MKFKNILLILIFISVISIAFAAPLYEAGSNISVLTSNTSCTQTGPYCGSWSTCSGSSQSRSCVYYNYTNICGNITSSTQSRTCSSSSGGGSGGSGGSGGGAYCNEKADCSNWSICSEGYQNRDCQTSACGFSTLRTCADTAPIVQKPIVTETPTCQNTTTEKIVEVEKNVTITKNTDIKDNKPFLYASLAFLLCLFISTLIGIIKRNKLNLTPKQARLYYALYKYVKQGAKEEQLIEAAKKNGWSDNDIKLVLKQIHKDTKKLLKNNKIKEKQKF